jgi:hypothetical protein
MGEILMNLCIEMKVMAEGKDLQSQPLWKMKHLIPSLLRNTVLLSINTDP